MTRFNAKTYRGKARVYIRVPGTVNISRLFVWNDAEKEYQAPARGKCYLAKRWEPDGNGKRKRKPKYFETLDAARVWQQYRDAGEHNGVPNSSVEFGGAQKVEPTGPLFGDVVAKWKRIAFPTLREGTRIRYENFVRLYCGELLATPLTAITPGRVDDWIADLISNADKYGKASIRLNYINEVKILRGLFNFWREYDDNFVSPIRLRHMKAARIARRAIKPKKKDVPDADLALWLEALTKGPDAKKMHALGTLQFHQANRISEAAAVHWEDLQLNFAEPRKSRITFVRYVFWPRKKGRRPVVMAGFKNSDGMDGTKEHPMMPEVFEALASLWYPGATGLVFRTAASDGLAEGIPFTYRELQYRYDKAFERAGLPYSATHVMRHGGTRRTLDATGGDVGVAQQLLGNKDRKSVDTYAVRAASALTEHAEARWSAVEAAHPGRKWSQTGKAIELVKGDQEDAV